MESLKRLNVVVLVVFCVLYFPPSTLNAQVSGGFCPVSTITKEVDYSDILYWSVFTEVVQPGECVDLDAEGIHPPFQLSIEEGTGFYIELGQDDSYKLCADGSACGTTKIKVTDDRGHEIFGYVRSSAGRWVDVFPVSCPSPGPPTYVNGNYRERIAGKWKMKQWDQDWYTISTLCSWGGIDPGECDGGCPSGPGETCSTVLECSECVDNPKIPANLPAQYDCGNGTYEWVQCRCVSAFELEEYVCQ